VRFKKVALWSFKSAREEFYRALEKTFADYFNVPFSGKNDRWQSFGVLEASSKRSRKGRARTNTIAIRRWYIPNHVRVACAERSRNLASPLFGHSYIKGADLAAT